MSSAAPEVLRPVVGAVEIIDVTTLDAPSDRTTIRQFGGDYGALPGEQPPNRSSAMPLLVMTLTLVLLVAIGRAAESASTRASDQPTPIVPTTTSTIAVPQQAAVPAEHLPWPGSPHDHDPTVSGSPAIGRNLVAGASGHTLIFVNSIGRPTVVDLENGRRQELSISPSRALDFFMVEDGQIVDDDPVDSNLPLGTPFAMPIFVHQVVDPPTGPVAVELPPLDSGPHLCIDPSACRDAAPTSLSYRRGPHSVDAVSISTHPWLAELFESANWTIDGRFLEAADFKIPRPRPGTTLWLISTG